MLISTNKFFLKLIKVLQVMDH